MAPDILKNENYIVLFIDVLGAKNMIMNDPDGFLNKFNYVFTKQDVILNELQRINNDIKIKNFSDNVVIYAKLTNDERGYLNLSGILRLSALIQSMMFIEAGFMVRGSIVVGKLYANDIYVIGPALVTAYTNENLLAKNPEIYISPETYDHIKKIFEKHEQYSKNDILHITKENDHYYLDYLRYYEHVFITTMENPSSIFDPIINHKVLFEKMFSETYTNTIPRLDVDKRKKIISKYYWVAKYHNDFCEDLNCQELNIDNNFMEKINKIMKDDL